MFFVYLQEKLIPGIFMHWKKYQEGLIEKLKHHGDIVVAGDSQHDSMGHSAKYCNNVLHPKSRRWYLILPGEMRS